MKQGYLHLNAYCRNLNGIKADCKCQLLGLKKIKKFNHENGDGNEGIIFKQTHRNQ